MIIIFISGLIGVLCVLRDTEVYPELKVLGGFLFGAVGASIGFMVALGIGYLPFVPYDVMTYNTRIASLERGSVVEGSFVLGTGNIEGKMVYLMYAEAKGGGYILDKVPACSTKIVEGYDDALLVRYENEFKDKRMNYVAIPKSCDRIGELRVPAGTIVRRFKV